MTYQAQKMVRPSTSSHPQQEISRILTAAVINAHFRQLLLTNPAGAIASGYGGEAFHLGKEEKRCLASIRATSLADFASQLANTQTGQSMTVPCQAGD